mmetsp:Transcript_39048/g.76127  ORF Transcript_39048/g.76127 Transcript_39048/m.76127 type:complete len:108 (-) Transcript_39048:435-758(-)
MIDCEVRIVTKINPNFEPYFDNMDDDEVREYVEDWSPRTGYTIQLIQVPIQYGTLRDNQFVWSDGLKDPEAKYEIEAKCAVIDKSEIMADLEKYISENREEESESDT